MDVMEPANYMVKSLQRHHLLLSDNISHLDFVRLYYTSILPSIPFVYCEDVSLRLLYLKN